MPEAKSDTITLLHFNDVYNVDSRLVEPVGGAARFLTAVKTVSRDCQPLILFSGDIFAPSISEYSDAIYHRILGAHLILPRQKVQKSSPDFK